MLRFAGDRVLVIADRTARALDLAGGGEHVLEVAAERVIDIAGFPDQIWVAERDAAGGAALVRLGLDGRRLPGPSPVLPSANGRWVPGVLPTCAVWNGPEAAVVSAAASVAVAPISERADLIIPHSAARLAVVRGAQIAFRTGASARWVATVPDARLRVCDGAFLYDGSSLAAANHRPLFCSQLYL